MTLIFFQPRKILWPLKIFNILVVPIVVPKIFFFGFFIKSLKFFEKLKKL